MKLFKPIFILILLFTLCLPALANSPISVKSVKVDSALESKFNLNNHLWQGADGLYSIPIGFDRYLWLFGDTLLAKVSNNQRTIKKMIHNSIGIQSETVSYFWKNMDDFFPKPQKGEWLWPGPGVVIKDKTFIFMPAFKHHSGGGDAFSFGITGSYLLSLNYAIQNPQQWRINIKPLKWGGSDHFYTVAGLLHNDYVYIYGYRDFKPSNPLLRTAVLARIKSQDLYQGKLDQVSYFSGIQGWISTASEAVPLFADFHTEASVHYEPQLKRFIEIQNSPGLKQSIQMRTSFQPEGPWSQPIEIYQYPDVKLNKRVFCYAAKAHPHLSNVPNELVIGYACNSTNFADLAQYNQLYRPRFIRVLLRE